MSINFVQKNTPRRLTLSGASCGIGPLGIGFSTPGRLHPFDGRTTLAASPKDKKGKKRSSGRERRGMTPPTAGQARYHRRRGESRTRTTCDGDGLRPSSRERASTGRRRSNCARPQHRWSNHRHRRLRREGAQRGYRRLLLLRHRLLRRHRRHLRHQHHPNRSHADRR